MKNLYYDVVIAGCGVAGLYAALNLPEEMNILMLSKKDLESCDSMLAQGGICVLRDESDYDSYFEDTFQPGCDQRPVEFWCPFCKKSGWKPCLYQGGSSFPAEDLLP